VYCLDTNILVDILRGDKVLGSKVNNLMDQGTEFFITPITLCELYRGAHAHIHRDSKLAEINSFIINFTLLDFGVASCDNFGKIYFNLKKLGKPVGEFDLIIASIVKSYDLTLITRNKKDFENTGAKLEVW